jgi:hypothetical protein
MSELLKEYIVSTLVEITSNDARSVGDLIVSAGKKTGVPPLEVKVASDREIRIAPSEGSHVFSEDEIKKTLMKAGLKIDKIIPKKAPGSISGTFPTYIVSKGANKFPVIFTRGRNEGQVFEDTIAKEAEDLKSGIVSPRIASLLKEIGINPRNIKDSLQTGGKNQARPLLSSIPNVGPVISDLTLILKRPDSNANSKDGKTVYISLKNPTGDTFANTGYAGGFVESEDKSGAPIVLSGKHPTDDFLKALGVNKNLAAKGFTNVLRGEKAPVADAPERFSKKSSIVDLEPVGSQDYKKVQTYLASAYGYGYWYARDMGGGNWHVEKIKNEKDAIALVGEVRRIDISYPGLTKQITCSVITTKGRYIVEVRNTQRGIVPQQVNVRIG